MIIGEAPGRQEDIQGRPFVGAAGKLLTKLLEEAGIPRPSVFITNVVKCRPPENRQPNAGEREACSFHLNRQLQHLQPRIIALVGRVAAETLLGRPVKMGSMHGKIIKHSGETFMILYHPAAGLYNQELIAIMVEDMRQLQELLDPTKERKPAKEESQLSLSQFFTKPKK